MLLLIDVGNTNTVLGVTQDQTILHRWRVTTTRRTTDEFGLMLLQLMEHQGLAPRDIEGISVSCVVPSVVYAIDKACRRYLSQVPLIIGHGVKTRMAVRTDNPREVGADRIVNALAAFDRYGGPLVVVDFGTATTFDCVNVQGHYIGGAISPGFRISADALFTQTAKLPRVEVERPSKVIGSNTIESMQSGLFWGYVGLVNELARRCKAELQAGGRGKVHCVATGGLANLIGKACSEIERVDDNLTLDGLRLLWEINRRPGGR